LLETSATTSDWPSGLKVRVSGSPLTDFAHLLAGRQVVNPEPVVALMRPQGTKGEEAAIGRKGDRLFRTDGEIEQRTAEGSSRTQLVP